MNLRRFFMGLLFFSTLSAVPGIVVVVSTSYFQPARPLSRLLRHVFAHPWALVLLALVPAVLALQMWTAERRRRVLARLGSFLAIESLLAVRRGWGVLRGFAFLLGLTLLAVGIAAPKWGGDEDVPVAPGRDLVVVLDCSRSMFAEKPSRFERAREALLDLSREVQKRGGHRLGLVIFAGRPELACPLTHDYDHFRATLKDLDPDVLPTDIGPGDHGKSGTRIGEGLTVAVAAHDALHPETADILLLSDGDDPLEGKEWRDGIKAANAQKIPIYVVGVGDPNEASTIPFGSDVLKVNDKEVRTRLEEEPLKEIAHETGGTYFPAHTHALPLGTIYLRTIAAKPLREANDDKIWLRREHYFCFLLPAFILFAVAVALPDRLPKLPRLRWRKSPSTIQVRTP